MKKIFGFILICGLILSYSTNSAKAQNAEVKLTVDMSNCDLPANYHCKVTLCIYTGENCTGTESWCYDNFYNNPTFNNTIVSWNNCSISTGTHIKVYVAVYDTDHPGPEICHNYSNCLH